MAKRGQELTEKQSSNVQSQSYPEDRMESDSNHQKGMVCVNEKSEEEVGLRRRICRPRRGCHHHAKNSSTSCSKAVTREQNLEVTLVCRPW